MPALETPPTTPPQPEEEHTPHFSSFLAAASPPNRFIHNHKSNLAEATSLKIRETRRLFAQGTPEDGKADCAPLDRRAVLDIYAQALEKLGTLPHKHEQIAAECARKVGVVLGMINPKPCDPVFTTSGQLLKPLQPQYAHPRIWTKEDEYGYRAQWRLEAWRREGWPEKYPGQAVSCEASGKAERLVGRGSLRNAEMRRRVVDDHSLWEDGGRQLESSGKGLAEEVRATRRRKTMNEMAEKLTEPQRERESEQDEVMSEGTESCRCTEDEDGYERFDDEDDDWS
jgi:hypothetical protein